MKVIIERDQAGPVVIENIDDLVLFSRTGGKRQEIIASGEEFMCLVSTLLERRIGELYLDLSFQRIEIES